MRWVRVLDDEGVTHIDADDVAEVREEPNEVPSTRTILVFKDGRRKVIHDSVPNALFLMTQAVAQ